MKKLSGLDAIFLRAETPTMPMNVVATVVIDPGDAAAFRRGMLEVVLERVRERVPFMPPFRRRLVETPLSLDAPRWIEDPDFDAADHVRHTLAPQPGGPAALHGVVARIAARPLDRSRPLWELWVVEGLQGDRFALVIKAHHAALDGVSGAALLLHLFDRPETVAPEPWAGERPPTPGELLTGAATRLGARGLELATAARAAGSGFARVLRSRVSDAAPVRDAAVPFAAPATSFNRAISARRAVAYARTPLDPVATIREAFGGTINDVVLAACTSALRDYLIERNELPTRPLVAAVPVSTRDTRHEPGGNHISAMLVELPVQVDDALYRYWQGCRAARNAKRLHGHLGNDTLGALAELAPGPLVGRALRLYSQLGLAAYHRPFHNLVISNVPGPPVPLALGGARVEALHPHGPVMEGAGLNITVMSYAGSLDVGILACRDAVPEVDELARGVAGAVESLRKRAEAELTAERRLPTTPRLRAAG